MIDSPQAARLRLELVAGLLEEDGSLSVGWRPAFERVPRHLFVPRFYRQNSRDELVEESDGETWLSLVYSDRALVTRVHNHDQDTPLSSSSSPSVMWQMLDALDVEPGHRVLEIGTGTGYNAAILCERLGSANVTGIDVDAELVAAAGERLRGLGYAPVLAAGDGAQGYLPNAPYDRVVATCAAPRVPQAWIDQARSGGLVCAMLPYGLVRLRVGPDGSASGRFHPTCFDFMDMRAAGPSAEPVPVTELFALARSSGGPLQTGAAAAARIRLRAALWMVVRIVALPELAVLDLGEGALGFVDRASKAWARVVGDQVVGGGPLRLWEAVESVYARWLEAGEPDREGIGLSVDVDRRQWLWLNSPESGYRWEL